jgi:hypothetical protein
MYNRRRLMQERLQVYLVTVILKYRKLIMITGLLLLAYALAIVFTLPLASYAVLLPAVFLLLLCSSYKVVVITARLGARIGTLWGKDE